MITQSHYLPLAAPFCSFQQSRKRQRVGGWPGMFVRSLRGADPHPLSPSLPPPFSFGMLFASADTHCHHSQCAHKQRSSRLDVIGARECPTRGETTPFLPQFISCLFPIEVIKVASGTMSRALQRYTASTASYFPPCCLPIRSDPRRIRSSNHAFGKPKRSG